MDASSPVYTVQGRGAVDIGDYHLHIGPFGHSLTGDVLSAAIRQPVISDGGGLGS